MKWKFEPYALEIDSDIDSNIDDGPLYGVRLVWLRNERGALVYLGGLFISLTWLRVNFLPMPPLYICPCGDPICDYGQ